LCYPTANFGDLFEFDKISQASSNVFEKKNGGILVLCERGSRGDRKTAPY